MLSRCATARTHPPCHGRADPSTPAPAEPNRAAGLGSVAVIRGATPQRDSKPGRGRLRRGPKVPQPVPTRRCRRAEIKVSRLVAGKCKYRLNKLLIVKPHYLGVIIVGTPCTANMRPRALRSWAPQEEDVSCLRAECDESCRAETWEWGKKKRKSLKCERRGSRGTAPEAVARVPWGSHGNGDPPDGEGDGGDGEGDGGDGEG